MEGKTVILSVLMMSLLMAQIQVEAKSCCPTRTARSIYDGCRKRGNSPAVCARSCDCKLVPDSSNCPQCCPFSGPSINEYCDLGCTSSVCGALTTLKNSVDASEIVNEALEKCTKACSTLCTKGSNTALDQVA